LRGVCPKREGVRSSEELRSLRLEAEWAEKAGRAEMVEHVLTKSILSWLLDARRPTVPLDPADGSIRLDFGRAYRIVVLLLALLATGFLIGVVLVFQGDASGLTMAGLIAGTMWLAFMYGLYDAFMVTLKASGRGLESRSPITGLRVLPWESIAGVSYASTGNWYRFKSEWGWSIRVSIYRNGLKSFSALVDKHIGQSPARRTPKDFYRHTAGF